MEPVAPVDRQMTVRAVAIGALACGLVLVVRNLDRVLRTPGGSINCDGVRHPPTQPSDSQPTVPMPVTTTNTAAPWGLRGTFETVGCGVGSEQVGHGQLRLQPRPQQSAFAFR